MAEERQIQGRTGRQGQQGSYSLVLRAEDLREVYGVSAEQIGRMRADGRFYDELHKKRCEHFEAGYQDLTKQIESFEATCHAPSMKLLKLVVRTNQDEEAKKLLMLFNKTPSPKLRWRILGLSC